MNELLKPALARSWAKCPFCGKNSVLHDDTASANGIWIKCKQCGCEYELILEKGQQKNTAKTKKIKDK